MIQRGFERKAAGKEWKIDKQWKNFDEIADPMKRAAVAAEDQTFLENHGFDFNAIGTRHRKKPAQQKTHRRQHHITTNSKKRFPLAGQVDYPERRLRPGLRC